MKQDVKYNLLVVEPVKEILIITKGINFNYKDYRDTLTIKSKKSYRDFYPYPHDEYGLKWVCFAFNCVIFEKPVFMVWVIV